ncbi:MAG: molybdopterin adenylyltransferase [Cytophagaceae bacterium]|jgi:molybdopterin adenylyltransferase|nr:molybdopterin adenylyltransferase [Cytophagaceae bacterium]
MTCRIGILTVSDRASKGIYEDISGKAIEAWLIQHLSTPFECMYQIIPDEQALIEETLLYMADSGASLLFTTGGTGPAKRDVTVEATESVCEKILPGFGECMRSVSLQTVPTAILSRQTAGIYKNTLIINLPGKPAAIDTCLQAVFPAIPYCIDLIEGPYIDVYPETISIFRPKK